MSRDEDLTTLGLPLGKTPLATAIKAAYRVRAAKLHPDLGGNADDFAALVDAYRRLTSAAEKRPCAGCRGTRRAKVQKGFNVTTVPCPDCQPKKEKR